MGRTMQAILEKELLQGGKSRYGIYRLRQSEAYCKYSFCGLDVLRRLGVTPKKEMYALVYVGELVNDRIDLEWIFARFNEKHPSDFFAASVSVGDIIVMQKKGKATAYFVEPIGFSELPGFLGENQKREQLTQKCSLCGALLRPGKHLCHRCSLLERLLGELPTLEKITEAFWDHCFACESELIASVQLTPESLVIQCDDCGETHTVPFREEDLRRYLRGGVIRAMVAEEDC